MVKMQKKSSITVIGECVRQAMDVACVTLLITPVALAHVVDALQEVLAHS
jgi:hypothetical protein